MQTAAKRKFCGSFFVWKHVCALVLGAILGRKVSI